MALELAALVLAMTSRRAEMMVGRLDDAMA
jgi:hypothetical protein